MSRNKRTEPPASVDPFDHTVIIPGVPELPQEATLVLPVDPPRQESEAPRPETPAPTRPGRVTFIALWIGAVALLTGGFTWWLLGTGISPASSRIKAQAAPAGLPPSMRGYLDAAQKGDAKAMRMLGACYTYGLGVRPDPAQGAEWYKKAAEAGDKTAAQEWQAISAR
ncbi:MAG TPA: hypothetical protein VL181_04700 [Holophagaceae bacterium]|nr:hypothetical protein [Holophagaceae bacterium]